MTPARGRVVRSPLSAGTRVALTAVTVLGTAACSPAVRGAAGLSVDAAGHPVVVLAWCDDETMTVEVVVDHEERYVETPGATGDRSAAPSPTHSNIVDGVSFQPVNPDGRSGPVRIDAASDGWQAEPGPVDLEPGVTYIAFGRGSGKVTTSRVHFQPADLEKLKPGQVLVQRRATTPPSDTGKVIRDTVIPHHRFVSDARNSSRCDR